MSEEAKIVLYVARVRHDVQKTDRIRYWICDPSTDGARDTAIKARGYQAAVAKWLKQYGLQPDVLEKMVRYTWTMRPSEAAMTLSKHRCNKKLSGTQDV